RLRRMRSAGHRSADPWRVAGRLGPDHVPHADPAGRRPGARTGPRGPFALLRPRIPRRAGAHRGARQGRRPVQGRAPVRHATDAEGKPDFHFLDTRYVGNVTSSDRGQLIHRSLISFRVQLAPVPEDELTEAGRSALPGVLRPEWRPLPIRRLEAALVFAPTG